MVKFVWSSGKVSLVYNQYQNANDSKSNLSFDLVICQFCLTIPLDFLC